MRKKLLVCLCTFAIALGLTACGSSNDDFGGRTSADYQLELSSMMTRVTSLNESDIEMNIQSASQYEDGAIVVNFLEDYKKCYDSENELVGFYSPSTTIGGVNIGKFNIGGTKAFSVQKSGKTITATLIGQFSKRDLKLTYVYNANDVSAGPTAINIEPVYTLGETMGKAGLNTVMGILIVFCMLIVMSGVIKCFEIIPKLQNRAKGNDEIVVSKTVETSVASSKNETDDLQLVAVIAAAIAASTGASTDSFVVRSIKKR